MEYIVPTGIIRALFFQRRHQMFIVHCIRNRICDEFWKWQKQLTKTKYRFQRIYDSSSILTKKISQFCISLFVYATCLVFLVVYLRNKCQTADRLLWVFLILNTSMNSQIHSISFYFKWILYFFCLCLISIFSETNPPIVRVSSIIMSEGN